MVPGTLHFDPRCPLCCILAGLAGLLDWRGSIGLRPMSEEEYQDVGAPFFRGTEGGTIVGVGPVARRWVKEVLHPRPRFSAPVEA
jgi:hypothetical protein